MRPMLFSILISAASAACGADERRAVDRLTPTSATRLAELSNRDKSWTTARLGERGVSQAADSSALTTRRSFQAEGTGLEPAAA